MRKFEYKKIRMHWTKVQDGDLNELGRDGWELISADGSEYIFKRIREDLIKENGIIEILSSIRDLLNKEEDTIKIED